MHGTKRVRYYKGYANLSKCDICAVTSHVLYKQSNGEQASLVNLKLTIGSLLACS